MKKICILLVITIILTIFLPSCGKTDVERVTNVFRAEEIKLPEGFIPFEVVTYDGGFAAAAESDGETKLFRFESDSDQYTEQPLKSYGSTIAAFSDGRVVSVGGDFIEIVSKDGTRKEAKLADIFAGGNSVPFISCVDGAILIATQSFAAVLNDDLTPAFILPVQMIYSTSTLDGRLALESVDFKTAKRWRRYVDLEKEDFGEAIDASGELLDSSDGIFAKVSSGITESGELICDFVNSDINVTNIRDLALVSRDEFIMTYNGTLYRAVRVPENEIAPKTLIRVAGSYINPTFREKAIELNLTNAEYRIVIDDYSVYNSAPGDETGVEKLKNDIISGYRPDMMLFSSYYPNNLYHSDYMERGLFADLYGLIDSDPEISRDDIPGGILKAGEHDGKLLEIPLTVNARVLVTNDYPGDSWTLREFLDYVNNGGENLLHCFSYGDPSGTLYLMLTCSMEEFIDADKNVNFDSELFRDALEYAKNSAGKKSDESRAKVIMSASPLNLCCEKVRFGNDVKFLGYPDRDGNGVQINTSGSVAIVKDSKSAKVAWEFIKELVGSEISKEATRNKMKENISKNSYIFSLDGSGYGFSPKANNPYQEYDKTQYVLRDPTPEVDEYIALLDGAGTSLDYESDLFAIIKEEAEIYFANAKTLDETVKIIQNRAETYISERN